MSTKATCAGGPDVEQFAAHAVGERAADERARPVLALVATQPRSIDEIVDGLRAMGPAENGVPPAREALRRLRDARLVWVRRRGGASLFAATARGRRELALQRLVLARTARAADRLP
jgi:hypothetical protein